ncbi:MAG: guanine deaminase [Pseudomonadales bacterium]
MTDLLLRGPTLSFSARPDPGVALALNPAVQFDADSVVVVRGEQIHDVLPAASFAQAGGDLAQCEDLRDALILPGFIDTHIHYPQMDMIASYGSQLLEWLERYAFPTEAAFASNEHAQLKAEAFLDRLFAHGTTTALTFTTVHPGSVEALFTAANRRNVRLIAGKVLMDRNAPDNLRDTGDGVAQCAEQIERWHGQGRLAYAITPRFAITCSDAQLSAAGELLQRYPDLYLHTHLAEHPDEISATMELFPDARDYLDVYDRFGMVGERSVFAHGIHLSDAELTRLAQVQATIAFCPSSNLFLGSGLLDLERLRAFDVPMSVATDVGAGTSFSMLATLGDGYKVAQLNGQSLHPLTAMDAITRGNAQALGVADRIGRLAAGYEADITVLRPRAGTVLADRVDRSESLTDRLFAYMLLAGEDAVARCYVAGKLVHERLEIAS